MAVFYFGLLTVFWWSYVQKQFVLILTSKSPQHRCNSTQLPAEVALDAPERHPFFFNERVFFFFKSDFASDVNTLFSLRVPWQNINTLLLSETTKLPLAFKFTHDFKLFWSFAHYCFSLAAACVWVISWLPCRVGLDLKASSALPTGTTFPVLPAVQVTPSALSAAPFAVQTWSVSGNSALPEPSSFLPQHSSFIRFMQPRVLNVSESSGRICRVFFAFSWEAAGGNVQLRRRDPENRRARVWNDWSKLWQWQ